MIPKIITPSEKVLKSNWNNHLPQPLTKGEKVIVKKKQKLLHKGYIRVKHGKIGEKMTSVFNLNDFVTLKGKKLEYNGSKK